MRDNVVLTQEEANRILEVYGQTMTMLEFFQRGLIDNEPTNDKEDV